MSIEQIFYFRVNPEVLHHIQIAKGWKTVADISRAVGYTQAYVMRILTGEASPSSEFMLRFISSCGMDPKDSVEWSRLFKIEIRYERHPKVHDNMAKYRGEKPCESLSSSNAFRKKDRAANLERPLAIPAQEFYPELEKAPWWVEAKRLEAKKV